VGLNQSAYLTKQQKSTGKTGTTQQLTVSSLTPKALSSNEFFYLNTIPQFPSVGLLDLNCNLQGPTDYLRAMKRDISFEYETVRVDDTRAPIDRRLQFNRCIVAATKLSKQADVKTIVCDDLTELNQLIIDDLELKHGKEMEQSMWIPHRKAILLITNILKGSGKHIIMLCHE
jgi:hypothetical protein